MKRPNSLDRWARDAGEAARRAYHRAVHPLWAMQARRHRARYCANYVVVTGSCGKSTTTMLAARLVGAQAVVESLNVHNTIRWITRKLRKLDRPVDYLIQETTEFPKGSLRRAGAITRPDAVIVTSIGTDHLSTYRRPELTAAELREAVLTMSPTGVLCLSADEPLTSSLAEAHGGRTVFFGTHPSAEVRAGNVRSSVADRLSFDLHIDGRVLAVRTRFVGTLMLSNVLAALALVHGLGLDIDRAVAELGDIEPLPGRMSVEAGRDGHTYLLDVHKAPFWSTRLLVEDLPQLSKGRIIFVLSDMSDTGSNRGNKYRQVLRRASERADLVVGIGGSAAAASRLRALEPSRTNLRSVGDMDQLARLLRAEPPSLVVIKGSEFGLQGADGCPISRGPGLNMSKADEKAAREQRLATKLRENLKRRKGQARARAADASPPSETKPDGKSS